MTIPQVNALATDRNRKQTKRICELLGYEYDGSCWTHFGDGDDTPAAYLPDSCLTLDQVVGMLDECNEQDCELVDFDEDFGGWRWMVKGPPNRNGFQTILGEYTSENPFDLTAAMDALIKALENGSQKTGEQA